MRNLNVLKEEREHLRAKLVLEGLNDIEMTRLASINTKLNEAPIDYEGPERMEPGIERKISGKETPYHNFPAIPKMDRDFIELIRVKYNQKPNLNYDFLPIIINFKLGKTLRMSFKTASLRDQCLSFLPLKTGSLKNRWMV
jgi:hypothetical protein